MNQRLLVFSLIFLSCAWPLVWPLVWPLAWPSIWPSLIAAAEPQKQLAQGQLRTLTFPTAFVSGSLVTVSGDIDNAKGLAGQPSTVSIARGTVKIKVPASDLLVLRVNRDLLVHPQSIKQISEQGIDCLKIAFYAMEDSESDICDKALQYLPHFRHLQIIDVDHSNVSDVGLSKVVSLPKLRVISAMMTDVKGSFFKDLPALTGLQRLNFDHCPIDLANIAYLPKLTRLKTLSLCHTKLTDQAVEQISKCPSLSSLKLAKNPKITDLSLKYLSSVKNLKFLDLRATGITMAGLKQLTGLPLRVLVLDQSFRSVSNTHELKKLFPHTNLDLLLGGIDKEDMVIFDKIH